MMPLEQSTTIVNGRPEKKSLLNAPFSIAAGCVVELEMEMGPIRLKPMQVDCCRFFFFIIPI
jgi:hypothetical protein